MLRIGLMATLIAGCANNGDPTLLIALDGNWSGNVTVAPAIYPATAVFTWDEEKQFLSGEISIAEPELTHDYAVRRSATADGEVSLELTDATDGTRGLRVTATVAETMDGDATLRYPCDSGTCGYIGVLALTKGVASLGTPTGDTGAR